MGRVDEFKKLHGQEISKELLNEIISDYYITGHALDQLKARAACLVDYTEDGRVNIGGTKYRVNFAITNYTKLAYFNTDGTVNIALNKNLYFVFSYNDIYGNWTMVTFKESSWYGNDIYDKQQMALDGYDRQYK